MTDVLETLKAMRRLLTPEGSWCQGHFAVNSAGSWVDHCGLDAVSWCLIGAAERVTGEKNSDEALLALHALHPQCLDFNDADGRTQAEVLELLDRKIAELSDELRREDSWIREGAGDACDDLGNRILCTLRRIRAGRSCRPRWLPA